MNNLKLYNSLSKKKEEFKPIKDNEIGLYTCGPTVYNYAHIGNLRTYIFEDILKRVLIYNGYKVKHVMNITDVGHLTGDMDMGEDKLEKSAKKENKTAWDVADFYTKAFKEDIKKLNILEPDVWCKATDYIEEQIDLIKILEEKEYTYIISDGIYFDTSKFKDYNKLSHLKLDELQEGARVEKNKEKRNSTDFALWKFSEPHSSPFFCKERGKISKRQMEWWFIGKNEGKLTSDTKCVDDVKNKNTIGFPGWHLECSAMSMKELGDQLDIHCGGIDHINVHHTNEIAQSEAATGKKFFNVWMHGAFLNIKGGKKMAKSEDNFLTIDNAFTKDGYLPLAYRFATLKTHYRKPMEWIESGNKSKDDAQYELNRLNKQMRLLYQDSKVNDKGEQAELSLIKKGFKVIEKYEEKFIGAINNDLNMPQALAVLYEVLKSSFSADEKLLTILKFDNVLGLKLKERMVKVLRGELSDNIEKLKNKREKAREENNFSESDRLRDEIEKMGYIVEDGSDGMKVYKK